MTIKDKLKTIQIISNLTQTQLAAKLDVSFPTLNSWINEKSSPHAKKINKIDDLYKSLTGQKTIPEDKLESKKDLLKEKSKKHKDIIKKILSRPDIYDHLVLSLTYNSNSIEGSTLTESDTAAIIFDNQTLKNKDLIEHLEAKNHQTAMDFLFKNIKKNFKITEDFILELHQILMNSIREDAGTYRSHGVRILGANVPTANYLKVPKLMKELIAEINQVQKDLVQHVTQMHSKFEQIHPFSDGNGRIGRLIMAAMLLRKNYAPAIIKQEKKKFYYKYLQRSQQKGDFEQLQDFICDSIIEGFRVFEN
ncbi:helix-turn-helix domain-containing protein [Candidatus Peregrinibacteria bacterium]|nr:helix-turn-helix domain-containing protein [Candidatus Peregrinibacteria bacterium]